MLLKKPVITCMKCGVQYYTPMADDEAHEGDIVPEFMECIQCGHKNPTSSAQIIELQRYDEPDEIDLLEI